MSYPRPQSLGPYDNNPIRNLELVKPHPTQRYQSISIARESSVSYVENSTAPSPNFVRKDTRTDGCSKRTS